MNGLTIGAVGLRAAFVLKPPEDASDRYEIGIEGGLISYKGDSVAFSGGLLRDTSTPGEPDWIGSGILRAGDAFSLSAIFAFRDDAEKQFVSVCLRLAPTGRTRLVLHHRSGCRFWL